MNAPTTCGIRTSKLTAVQQHQGKTKEHDSRITLLDSGFSQR